jgi:Lamin Tail Domain/Stigma-specific protein, Stig1/Putative metal-binding motif
MMTLKRAFLPGQVAWLIVGLMVACGGKGSGGGDAAPPPCETEEDCQAGYDCVEVDGAMVCVAQPDAGPLPDANVGTPLMVLDATRLDFGNPLIGTAVEVDLTITNEGEGDLLLYDLQLVEDDDVTEFFLGAPPQRPIVVLPGDSTVVTVTLISEDAELDTGYLLLASNDPLHAAVLVPLVSELKGTPELGVCVHAPPSPPTSCADPSIFDFGLVDYSTSSELVARLRNENLGNAVLTVEEVTLPEPPVVPADLFDYELFTLEEDPGNPGSYTEVPASLPYLLGPQQSTPDLYLRLVFQADVDRLFPDLFVVVGTDASENASVELPLSWSVNGCPPGTLDLDPADPGCEYDCPVWPSSSEACNSVDDDCDGDVDEDFDLTSDPAHCGYCGHVCALPNALSDCSNSLCVITSCQTSVSEGFANVNGDPSDGCEYACPVWPTVVEVCNEEDDDCDGDVDEDFNLHSDPLNCGTCGNDCTAGGLVCAAGTCMLTCPPGTTNCSGACVDTDTDPDHCGACSNGCAFDNALATCLTATCVMGGCTAGFQNLDGQDANGCEYTCPVWPTTPEVCDATDNDCDGDVDETFDLQNDPVNCGSCGITCGYPNAQSLCVSGGCQRGPCLAGYRDLDGLDTNGCEYGCPVSPPVAEVCNGVDDNCDGNEDEIFDLQNDPAHCGDCATTCSFADAMALCVSGGCQMGPCSAGFSDLDSNPTNGCEYPCPVWPPVSEVCDSVDNNCNGTADEGFDTQNDPVNCGSCGTVCSYDNATALCISGGCQMGACAASFANVDGNPTTGCEYPCPVWPPVAEVCDGVDNNCDGNDDETFDLQNDPAHCGDCTTTCSYDNATELCVSGTCQLGPCSTGFGNADSNDANGCEYTCPVSPPVAEVCNGVDDNCDGNEDEGFDTQSDPAHCGDCTTTCSYANATPLCISGGCQMGACSTGFGNVDGSDANGCEYTCPVSPPVAEVCNGVDDNCDGDEDETFDFNNDPAHCGDCTTTCSYANATALCVSGTCQMGACDSGFGNTDSNVTNGCEYPCPVSPPVAEVCNGVDDNCDGNEDETFDLQADPAHCGNCTTTCSYANATALCVSGTCQMGACNAGFGNADGSSANGCECTKLNGGVEVCNNQDDNCDGNVDETFDFQNDPTHCGNCSTVCSYANATALCTNGTCQMGACNTGFGNADGSTANGCECTQLNGGVEICNNQDDNCDGNVDETFNLVTDPTHCGNCTTVCSYANAMPLCISGGCQMGACDAGFGDADSNPGNGCECTIANGGVELCNNVDDNCNGVADENFDFNNDPAHCGDCSTSCSYANAVALCVSGGCQMGACDAGYSDVDGLSTTGCEYPCPVSPPVAETCNNVDDNCNGVADENFDFNNDPNHCGDCSTVCAYDDAQALCVSGGCQMGACDAGYADVDGLSTTGCEYPCPVSPPVAETCNNVDDNCNGVADENFDFNNDPNHCGDCSTVCAFDNAQALCVGGTCQMGACDADYRDNNGVASDGCEYGCPISPPVAETCDGQDNDCDGDIDESFDFQNDPTHCGDCVTDCSKPNALVECVAATCNEVSCLPSYYDLNGDLHNASSNGCEYECPTHPPVLEVCDGVDNDCDDEVDEGFDLMNNPNHCGFCNNPCGADQLCCTGICVDDDETNCGYCGRGCSGGVNCFGGSCIEEGIVVITELMINPDEVDDAVGEWFEVYNPTAYDINLYGWEIRDDGADTHIINDDVWIPAGSYIVLGRNANYGTNGGVVVAYQYSGLYMGGSGDEVKLVIDWDQPTEVVVDYFAYTTNNFDDPGFSQQLDFDFLLGDNSDETHWCDTRNEAAYLLPAGDHGTPNVANHQCP